MAEAHDIQIVLASASPRRATLLRRVGIRPVVRPADVDEAVRPGEAARGYVARLAADKARSVDASGGLVIGADTAVVVGDRILGKPADRRDAVEMLASLSGGSHLVVTGVHVVRGDQEASAVEDTVVHFRELTRREIDAYVATGDADDKAGAYGIQGAAGIFVTRIEGSDTNVIGLPLAALHTCFTQVGVELLVR